MKGLLGFGFKVTDREDKYRPVILFNFKVIANIAPKFDSYRGYQFLIKTFDGKDFKIVLSYDAAALAQNTILRLD